MTNRPRAELLLGGSWVDVTQRLRRRSPVTVTRGRADELAQATSSQISMVLENTDGKLTPRNPASTWYPSWERGARCRVWVDGATPALIIPGVAGANAQTPDAVSLDITGTITVVARMDPEAWAGSLTFSGGSVIGGDQQRIVSKWTTGQQSWRLNLFGPGWLQFEWTSDGSTPQTITSTKIFAAQEPMWVAVTFRPNDGAGGKTAVWFTSADGVTFQTLATKTIAGTSSIFSGSAPVEVGTSDAGTASYTGRVLAVRIINGELAGTVVANPDFSAQNPGTRSFTDAAGKAWTVNGAAEIATRSIRGIGRVDEIQPDWPYATPRNHPTHPGVAHVGVTASGMLRRMGQGSKPIASTLFRFLTSQKSANAVKAYWPLEDGADAKNASSPMRGVRPMNVGGGSFRFATDSSLPSSKPLPEVSSGSSIAFAATVPAYSATQSRVDMFVRIDTPNSSPGTFITAVETNGTVVRWTIAVDASNVAVVGTDASGTNIVSSTWPSDSRMFGTWALWSFNIAQNGGNIDWAINVVPIPLGAAFGAGSAGGASGSVAGTVGVVTVLHNWLTAAPTTGGISYGHFIVSTGVNLGWLAGADTAFVGESAAHRFWRLCVEEDTPVHIIGDNTMYESVRGDTAASAAMGPQGQRTLVDLLSECAQVDGGIMSEHRTAEALDYRTRRSLYNQPAAIVLDTNNRGIGQNLEPVDDDQRLRNEITATRPNGSSARVTTEPPPEPGDLYDVDIQVNVEHDLQLPDQAGWRLHLGTWPAMRYPGLSTSLRSAGTTVARQWSDVALGDLFRLDNLPRQHEKTTDLILEGYTETLSFFDWTAALSASPAGPWSVGVRDDDVLGVRDTGGSVLNSNFVAGTDTTMSVATTLGPLWAVTAASNTALPFDVNVGGYRITVTAIGAAAGQIQSFTVSTTIGNGLTGRTIAAGTDVSLWVPCRRAL